MAISKTEREYLRELAKKQLGYSKLPIMEERRRQWLAHNLLKGATPPIVMELNTFIKDFLPQAKCVSKDAVRIENQLNEIILNHELVNDDKVVPDYFAIPWDIQICEFCLPVKKKHADDSNGKNVGFEIDYPIKDLEKDFNILKPSEFKVDRESTLSLKQTVEDAIGDILPVKIKNMSLNWHATITAKIVYLMGMENMLFAIMDFPEKTHALFDFIVSDIIRFVRWQEEEGLLVLNNGNDYVGAGSYGFTNELPPENTEAPDKIAPKDLWMNMNSQESVGISPEMYKEFIFPYYLKLAKEFGLVYYGCCEPVDKIWDCLQTIPNLRKVSISPWCDEEAMGERLAGNKVIYSRKPSPNFIGVGDFNEEAFSEHISKTLKTAKGCNLEIIFRDIYSLNGDISKPGRAIKIVRELIEKNWH